FFRQPDNGFYSSKSTRWLFSHDFYNRFGEPLDNGASRLIVTAPIVGSIGGCMTKPYVRPQAALEKLAEKP
ncbi:MAG: hypothetical protein LJE64_05905, partial [Desulfofustis sp.]|nr:hypothetical protein [Desulfofustis sp.]